MKFSNFESKSDLGSACFVAVFHVTDQNGNKLTDESVISYIEQVIIVTKRLI